MNQLNLLNIFTLNNHYLLCEKKLKSINNFFGKSNINLTIDDLIFTNKDYILESLNSHNKEDLQKKILKFFNEYNIQFINWFKQDDLYNKLSFQLFIPNVYTYSLLTTDKFLNLLNFYGYYLSQKFIITNKNKHIFNKFKGLGTYYTISPTWSDNVNDLVYNKNKGVLYHFTLKNNLDSILKNGLRIKSVNDKIPKRLYCYSSLFNIKHNNIWDDNIMSFVKDIFTENQLNKGISVFKIKLPINYYIDFYTDDIMQDNNAVYTYTNIPNKYLTYIGDININF